MTDKKDSKLLKLDNRPLYIKATEALNEMMLQGGYKPGDMLPKEIELARELGISRSTVRVALGYLESRGYISRRSGVGTFVTAELGSLSNEIIMGGIDRLEMLDNLARQGGVQAGEAFREIEIIAADQQIAGLLCADPGEDIIRTRTVATLDQRPAMHLELLTLASYIDRDELENRRMAFHVWPFLDENLKPTHTRSEISSLNASKEMAALLEVAEGASLLHLNDIWYAKEGQVVGTSFAYFVTDVFRFYIIRKIVQ
jgi:GntR family transcriptional regulator